VQKTGAFTRRHGRRLDLKMEFEFVGGVVPFEVLRNGLATEGILHDG